MIIIIYILSAFYATFYKTKRSLHMLQQNLYNENNRYLKWVGKNSKEFLDFDLLIVATCLVGIFVLFDLDLISSICMLVISALWVFIGFKWNKIIENDQNKKKLVVTARIKRLIFTTSALYAIPTIVLLFHLENLKTVWILLLIISLMVYLNKFVALLAVWINHPVERCVYYYYLHKAKTKLKSIPNLKVVGITGSYGKTSSKNILADILNVKYNTLPTPRNLNTPYGLMITINNHMDKFTEIFIAEMGAYVRGEVKALCKFVKPKYGILTRIGTAHLESFGSEENIQKGKFELIESLPADGVGVLNKDDPKQVNYELKNNVKILWIGIDAEDVDVRATDIKCNHDGTTFNVIFKGDKKKHEFQTKLLGKHNVYNILAALALGREFDISVSDLQQSVKKVKPVEHRLELKKLGNFFMIDDAYNSNPVGAENACKVLGMMPGTKIVVTPGMIELGEKENEYNKIFGEQISEVADYAILIGEKKTKPIKEGLLTKGFDKDKVIVFNDVREAYPYIEKIAKDKDVYALFENDLPDTYNEK